MKYHSRYNDTMHYIKEYYWKNNANLQDTHYGKLLISFKNGENIFWLIRPENEVHQLRIYNLNHKSTNKYHEIYNKNLPNSILWENSFVFLTESNSPVYKDIFIKVKHFNYQSTNKGLSDKQALTIIKECNMLHKELKNLIIRADNDSFYRELLNPDVKSFIFKNNIINKEYFDMSNYSIKSLKNYSRIYV